MLKHVDLWLSGFMSDDVSSMTNVFSRCHSRDRYCEETPLCHAPHTQCQQVLNTCNSSLLKNL